MRLLVRLWGRGILYEAGDRHHNYTADAATGHIRGHAERATEINTHSTQNGLEYLTTNAATHNPGYAVTDSA